LSGIIGIWHGYFGNKQKTTKEFLVGGGKMGVSHEITSLIIGIPFKNRSSLQHWVYSLRSVRQQLCLVFQLKSTIVCKSMDFLKLNCFFFVLSIADSTIYLYFGILLGNLLRTSYFSSSRSCLDSRFVLYMPYIYS